MAGFQGGCVEEIGPFVTEVCVRNVGEGDAGRFVLGSEGSGVIVEWEINELAAGEETCRESGASLGAVIADTGEAVDEANEENNSVIIPVPTPPAICTPTPDPQA
jgi:hypothetical protein